MTVYASRFVRDGEYKRTKNGGMGEKTHEIHANRETNTATRMVNQDLRGGVFHIRIPAYMGYRTTNNMQTGSKKTCDLRE